MFFLLYCAVTPVLPYHMDTPQKGPPGFQLTSLYLLILFLQRNVGGDIDRCIASHSVTVSCRECQRVNVQIVQHTLDWNLGMKFLKYQNRLSVVCVETDAVSATVIGDAANVGGGVFCIYAACLSCAGSAIQVAVSYTHLTLPTTELV